MKTKYNLPERVANMHDINTTSALREETRRVIPRSEAHEDLLVGVFAEEGLQGG